MNIKLYIPLVILYLFLTACKEETKSVADEKPRDTLAATSSVAVCS